MSFKISVQHVRAVAGVGAVVCLFLVGLGGYVRATGAGLSCPDWPLCYGRLIPHDFSGGVFQEVAHRYLASIVSVIVLGFAALSYANRRTLPRLWPWSRIMLLILASQVILGGLTVLLLLNPFIVTGHFIAGTAFFQLLALAALDRQSVKPESESVRKIRRIAPRKKSSLGPWILGLAGLCIVQMIIGAFVASSGASLACPSVPHCFPAGGDYTWAGPHYIQMTHRTLGVVLFLAAVILPFAARRLHGNPAYKRGHLFGVAFMIALQIGLGVANVYYLVPSVLAVAHLVLAQVILLSLFIAYRRLYPERSLYAPVRSHGDDEGELGEYTPTKRRFAANIR